MVSPDGKAARFIITHAVDPATAEGIKSVDQERNAAKEALKLTSLENADIYLGGTAATFNDIATGAWYDLLIAAVASIVLIFIIMVLVTRALVERVSSSARLCCRWGPPSGSRRSSGNIWVTSNYTGWQPNSP